MNEIGRLRIGLSFGEFVFHVEVDCFFVIVFDRQIGKRDLTDIAGSTRLGLAGSLLLELPAWSRRPSASPRLRRRFVGMPPIWHEQALQESASAGRCRAWLIRGWRRCNLAAGLACCRIELGDIRDELDAPPHRCSTSTESWPPSWPE